jgi:hypothetical protein
VDRRTQQQVKKQYVQKGGVKQAERVGFYSLRFSIDRTKWNVKKIPYSPSFGCFPEIRTQRRQRDLPIEEQIVDRFQQDESFMALDPLIELC